MKKTLIIALLAVATFGKAQENQGIKFEHGLSWKQIKEKARKENRYIFLDAYTTWCGPCKMMAKDIFPLKEVGDFYNANFINVKVQLDVTEGDDQEIKNWYKDARLIGAEYKINAYPTYLFINPSGELVHRIVGSAPANQFIAKGKEALNPETQYFSLVRQYEQGKKDPEFLLKLVNASQAAHDRELGPKFINEYLATQSDLLTKENLAMLRRSTRKSSDPGFIIFRDNPAKVDSILGKDASKKILYNVAMNEVVMPAAMKASNSSKGPDWDAIRQSLEKDFSNIADELIASAKPLYYQSKKDWPGFSNAVNEYFSKYSSSISADALNEYAWMIFTKCEDKECIQAALNWSRKSLDGKNAKNVMYMDTYANLLYKSGAKEEAIKLQEEAVKIAGEKPDGQLSKVLQKMKNGEKTW